jgi:hypothetical protein
MKGLWMNNRKMGKIFIVLMISLVAFGFGSCANAVNGGNDITKGMIPSSFAWNNQDQVSIISDSSFDPIRITKHFYNNTTNSTNSTNVVINNTTTNTTTPTKPTNGTKRN